ncbi:acyl-CoA thioesterase [Camelimonas abortus]|uniref:Acyl-CoA thioesterase n=1 Tax=Camelimonas abortus TaxID=1017184 RepID=A0ABV7LCE5_9HYPH
MRVSSIPGRRSLATYPFRIRIRAAYGDLDANHHINNVALSRFVEEACASLNMQVFGEDVVVRPSGGVQLLTASVSIDFVAQGHYPGEVVAAAGVAAIGRSSFIYATALFQPERCIAVAQTTLVYARDGAGVPVPQTVRAAMEPWLLRAAA